MRQQGLTWDMPCACTTALPAASFVSVHGGLTGALVCPSSAACRHPRQRTRSDCRHMFSRVRGREEGGDCAFVAEYRKGLDKRAEWMSRARAWGWQLGCSPTCFACLPQSVEPCEV